MTILTQKLDGEYVLAIDQGTSGTSAALYNELGLRVAFVDVPIQISHPNPGWVEQYPAELLQSIKTAFHRLISDAYLKPGQIIAMGLAHQGECLLLWDRQSGEPVYPMIGWQCTRSVSFCQELTSGGKDEFFRARTGLPINPEWPATKFPWAKENLPVIDELLRANRLVFSQSDSWFMYHLTNSSNILTDHSTASRSGFYNVHKKEWDSELVNLFNANGLFFPEIRNSADDFGVVHFSDDWQIPWCSNLLDQSAALLGQECINEGDVKITYGSCAGVWYSTGEELKNTNHLDSSIAWTYEKQVNYAVVAETLSSGTSFAWLRSQFGIEMLPYEFSQAAEDAKDSRILFIPSLNGWGAPHWAPNAHGALFGLYESMKKNEIIRGGLEAVAFSVQDVLLAFENLEGLNIPSEIKVDGGMTSNRFLMQFQANISQRVILVAEDQEATSRGVALLAGAFCGFYLSLQNIKSQWRSFRRYTPQMEEEESKRQYSRWLKAVTLSLKMDD